MALLDQYRDKLTTVLADAQSQVGTFLQQKSRILNMPQTLAKQTLLNQNADLQTRATSLLGQGTALKTRIDAFNTMNFASYGQIPGLVKDAGNLVLSLTKLQQDMSNHRQSVDAAAGSPPSSPSLIEPGPSGTSVSEGVIKAIAVLLVGGAAWGSWKRWGRK